MVSILHFFSSYSIIIYLILAIGLIFAIRLLVRARLEKNASLYGLERETAYRHISQGVAVLTLIILLAIAEFSVSVFLAPNIPATGVIATPTLNPLISPVFTIPPELLATIGLITPVSTQTPQTSGCIPGQIMITSPKPGDVVNGQVILLGTANIPNFGFYKYEFSAVGTDVWSTIQANRDVKQDGELGRWETSEVTPGDYNLRLVVLDNQGIPLPPCIVPVRVASP
jgi:hypothetical protein